MTHPTHPANDVSVTFDLTPAEALALAQFAKRSLFDTYREFAISEDEAYLMIAAMAKLREGLAAEGFNPR
jgi:hypothetical protein